MPESRSGFRQKSGENKNLKHDDDSKKRHHALSHAPQVRSYDLGGRSLRCDRIDVASLSTAIQFHAVA